jgi:hypothetical protein
MLYDRNIPQEEDSSDTRKVIEEHLTNEDHVITDEHIRNVKVGEEEDEPSDLGAEIEARFDEDDDTPETRNEDAGATDTTGIPDITGTPDTKPGTKPPNPWEVLG